ncbi:Dihydrodipicolinate synthase (fragment) [Klebsiella variicola]
MCISDNPGTTHFTFTDELHGRLSSLKGVSSVMFPDEPDSVADSWQRNH